MVSSGLRTVATVAAAIALLCCVLVLLLARLFPPSLYGGRGAHFELRLLLCWTLAEGLAAASNLVYSATEDEGGYVRPDGGGFVEVSVLCKVQGAFMHASYLSAFLWTLLLAWHRWLTTVRGQRHGHKWEGIYVLLAVLLPVVNTLFVWRLDYLGPTDLWCWISSQWHSSAQWVHFHLPLIGVVIVLAALDFGTAMTLRSRSALGQFGGDGSYQALMAGSGSTHQTSPTSLGSALRSSVPIRPGGVSSLGALAAATTTVSSSSTSAWSPSARHTTLLCLFVLLRLPGFMHRGWEWVRPPARDEDELPESYTLEVLHALASPLQGVLPLLAFLHSPRMSAAIAQKWSEWVGNGVVIVPPLGASNGSSSAASASSSSSSSSVSGSVSAASAGGYRSLAEDAAPHTASSFCLASRARNVENVFPTAVWAKLQQGSGGGSVAELFPPTHFRSFPLLDSQKPRHPATAASAAPAPSYDDPTGKFRVFAGSWNMGNSPPPMDADAWAQWDRSIHRRSDQRVLPCTASHPSLSQWVPSGAEADPYDILVIGVQECAYDPLIGRGAWGRSLGGWMDERKGIPSNEQHWVSTVMRVVNHGRDGSFVPAPSGFGSGSGSGAGVDRRPFGLVRAVSMGHIRLLVLLHPRHLPSLRQVRSASEASGLGNVYSNKGGVGISFRIGPGIGHSFAAVNVHLAALDGFADDRNEDVVQILSRLALRGSHGQGTDSDEATHARADECPCLAELDPLQSFDMAFFLGDLNYRLDVPLSPEALSDGLGPLQSSKRIGGGGGGRRHSKKQLKKLRQQDALGQVSRLLLRGDTDALLRWDELAQLQRGKKLFVGWREPDVKFMPTYKYKLTEGPGAKAKGGRKGAMKAYSSSSSSLSSSLGSGPEERERLATGMVAAEVDAETEAEAVALSVSCLSPSSSPPVSSVSSSVLSASASASAAHVPGSTLGLRSHDPSLYDSKRTPAYCDRILYRCGIVESDSESGEGAVQVLEYRDVTGVDSSDHKPVRLVCEVNFAHRARSRSSRARPPHGEVDAAESKDEASPDSDSLSSSHYPASVSLSHTSDTLLPPRRRKRTDSDSHPHPHPHPPPPARLASQEFLAAHPLAAEIISPASLRILDRRPASFSLSAAVAPQPKHVYVLELLDLGVYDVLDLYGLPMAAPYVAFVGEALCACNATAGGSGGDGAEGQHKPHPRGTCLRYYTSVAQPLPGAGPTLQSLARSLLASPSPSSAMSPGTCDKFSLFQSSPSALQGTCIRCAEWDAVTAAPPPDPALAPSDADADAPPEPAQQQRQVPLMVTPQPHTANFMRRSSLQLLLKDAQHQGTEAETLGTAVLPLGVGMGDSDDAGGASMTAPVFFIAPLLAQGRYMGFITGYLRVVPLQSRGNHV